MKWISAGLCIAILLAPSAALAWCQQPTPFGPHERPKPPHCGGYVCERWVADDYLRQLDHYFRKLDEYYQDALAYYQCSRDETISERDHFLHGNHAYGK